MSNPPTGGPGSDQTPEKSEGKKNMGLAAFRRRDFRYFFFGKAFASFSLHMVMVAITYQVYDLTGDPMNLAYIGLSIFAPAFGFALVTGYVADQFDRRFVLAMCYLVMMASAVLLALFSISGSTEVWPVFLILVLFGTGRAFYQPTSNALVPNLVPPEEFPNAVAWNTTANKLAAICGPALGGFLYLLGPEFVYEVSAVVLVMASVTVLMIKTRIAREGRGPITMEVLFAGVAYVFEKKVILGAITLDLFVVLLGGATALLPVFAKDILDVGAGGAGLLRAAIAVGGISTALVLTQITLTRAAGRIMFITVFIFGLATITFGLSSWFALSLLAMFVLGASDMVSVYIRQTLIQLATPDEKRGRVSAVNSIFINTSNEIGEFRAGVMAAWLGAVPAVVIGGVGSVIIAGLFWRLFPDLAKVERVDRTM